MAFSTCHLRSLNQHVSMYLQNIYLFKLEITTSLDTYIQRIKLVQIGNNETRTPSMPNTK